MAVQARRVQIIIARNLIARLTRSKPSVNFSALGMLTCAAFSGQATHPSSIGADSSIWQQVAENSCQRRGDVIEAQAGAVCDGQLGGYRSHWMPPAGYAGELSNLGNQVVGAIVRLNLTSVARRAEGKDNARRGPGGAHHQARTQFRRRSWHGHRIYNSMFHKLASVHCSPFDCGGDQTRTIELSFAWVKKYER